MSSATRSLLKHFNKFRRSKLKPSKKSSSVVADDSSVEKLVKRFIKSSEDPRFRHNQSAYKLAITTLAAAKKFSAIDSILTHQKTYEDIRCEGFAARLIGLYGRSAMFDHARKLFDELPHLNCDRGIVSYNALLKAALDSNQLGTVVELFNTLPEEVSIEPDLISYNIVIHAHCAANDLDSAMVLLHELEKSKKQPDLVTFNTLLNALYRNGRFSDGDGLFRRMESNGIVPDVRSYNSKLRGIFHEDVVVNAEEVFAGMEKKGIRPDVFSYNALISGYCKCGDLKEALKWYRELQRNECAPNLSTFLELIPACCEERDVDSAYELCKEAISRQLNLKSEQLKRVVNGLVAEDKAEEASKLVKLVNSAKFLNCKLKEPSSGPV